MKPKLLKYYLITSLIFILSSCAFLWDVFWNDIVFSGSCSCKVVRNGWAVNDSTYVSEWGEEVLWSGSAIKSKKADQVRKECDEIATSYAADNAWCECDD